MKPCNLKESDIKDVLVVLNNNRQSDFKSGSIRVKGLSRAAMNFLKSSGFIEKSGDGKYYPKYGRSSCYPSFSLQNVDSWLPVDILWHVVKPMLSGGHAGYSITTNKRWSLLNLYAKGEYGYNDANEQEIMRVLLTLAGYGYIWFQFGGSVWAIDERHDASSAAA